MFFRETKISGVFEIELDRKPDERGFFARTWCREEFGEHGLNPELAQCSISYNAKKGTLRGMHFQSAPHTEAKLVRCTQGSIFDVAIDLRPSSPTYTQWVGSNLSAENRNMLYIPEGCAHGFLTLEDHAEVLYFISEFYHPESSHGFRWNDPSFGVKWPGDPLVMSDRDRQYPDFEINRL